MKLGINYSLIYFFIFLCSCSDPSLFCKRVEGLEGCSPVIADGGSASDGDSGGDDSGGGGSETVPFSTNINLLDGVDPSSLMTDLKTSMTTDGLDISGGDTASYATSREKASLNNVVGVLLDKIKEDGTGDMNLSASFLSEIDSAGLKINRVEKNDIRYFVIQEKDPKTKGLGLFMIRADFNSLTTKLFVQTPHPLNDFRTPELGSEIVEQLAPAFYVQAGLFREHSTVDCGEVLPGNNTSVLSYKFSDASHNSELFFQSVSDQLSEEASYIIQLHGFGAPNHPALYAATPPVEVVLSAGTFKEIPTILSMFQTAFASQGVTAKIYPSEVSELGGTGNTQGHIIRGRYGNKFIHLETRTELRTTSTERQKIIDAISEAFL